MLSWPSWLTLQRTVYPHKWSPISCRSSEGQGKFAGQRPTFYHCATLPTNANCPPDFVMLQNFKHQIACIIIQYKAYQPHNSNSVFTISQKYIFDVHQITISRGKFNIFLASARINIPLRIH